MHRLNDFVIINASNQTETDIMMHKRGKSGNQSGIGQEGNHLTQFHFPYIKVILSSFPPNPI